MHRTTTFRTAIALAVAGALAPLAALAQATPAATPAAPTFGDVRVLGVATLPNDLMVGETLVGGLSGIDYDAATDRYYVISDDRSDNAPARFYTASVPVSEQGIGAVTIDGATSFPQADGTPYPNASAGGNVPDPESIRLDPSTGALFYTSEGSEKLQIDPFVASTTTDGHFIAQPALPPIFAMSPDGLTGPRDNLVFEGLSFDVDGQSLWLAMEGPLHQDGPTPTFDHGAVTRITNVDRSGAVLGQYAYELNPLPGEDLGGYAGSGVTEILAVDETRFLVVERAFVADADGVGVNTIKVYEIDIAGATDVKSQQWLTPGGYTPVSKTLVLDLAEAGVTPIDNVEGLTWGPTLANGNRTLVLVSDNNFNDTQVTEFIAVEVAS